MRIFKNLNAVFFVFVFLIFAFSSMIILVVEKTSSKSSNVVIVLDAGHGGRDGGSVGVNGTIESNINLEYVKLLEAKLSKLGYKIVLTRKNDNGLYSPFASNKKVSDMNKRMEIIKEANPNLVISIHMNSFTDSLASGAITYHKVDDEASIACATLIQKCLNKNVNAKLTTSKNGDYFMLNCSYYTSVLIECGFLSNPAEEKNLNDDEYKNKLTDAICDGVFLYFGGYI